MEVSTRPDAPEVPPVDPDLGTLEHLAATVASTSLSPETPVVYDIKDVSPGDPLTAEEIERLREAAERDRRAAEGLPPGGGLNRGN